MSAPVSARERLIKAAFELFDERGFAETSVDDIAERARVGRTTLFRHFGSKEGLVFPDHDELLARAQERLSVARPETMPTAVIEVATSVFDHYLAEAELAQARYRLTRSVPALRDYETATVSRYVRLFARHLRTSSPPDPKGQLRAELFAHAVVAAHNFVLRRWLRDETQHPQQELAEALAATLPVVRGTEASSSAVVILSTSQPISTVLPHLRDAVESLEAAGATVTSQRESPTAG
ncbi:MAG: TetR family transcriptional regulator [Mycobacterium sp.]